MKKNNKKLISGSKYYNSIIMIFLSCSIIMTAVLVLIAVITSIEENPSVIYLYYGFLPCFGVITIFLICFTGFYGFQFSIISESGITVRAPFRTIRKIQWEEVKAVRKESYDTSFGDEKFKIEWIIFDDGISRPIRSGFVSKKSYILIPNSERNEKIIKMFYDGEIQAKINDRLPKNLNK